jgi:hypothetical protein
MTDTEGFLGRWSRLKQQTKESPQTKEPEAEAAETALPCPDPADALPALSPEEVDEADETADIRKLPPIDSLGADSDYTGYLAPGVPEPLKLAALRKAWTSDPKIAEFRGFADYDWDCNAPGYGQLLPTDDIQQMVKNFLFSEPEERPDGPKDAVMARTATPDTPDVPVPDEALPPPDEMVAGVPVAGPEPLPDPTTEEEDSQQNHGRETFGA